MTNRICTSVMYKVQLILLVRQWCVILHNSEGRAGRKYVISSFVKSILTTNENTLQSMLQRWQEHMLQKHATIQHLKTLRNLLVFSSTEYLSLFYSWLVNSYCKLMNLIAWALFNFLNCSSWQTAVCNVGFRDSLFYDVM